MLGGIIGLFIIDFRLTLLLLVFFPVKFLVMIFFAKKQKIMMDEFILINQNFAKWFGDTVGGVHEIKFFNLFEQKFQEFIAKKGHILSKQNQINMLSQWNSVVDGIMVDLLMLILYILGNNLVFELQLSVGSVFAFITYSAYVTGPISAILNIGYIFSGILPSAKRYFDFLNLKEEKPGLNSECVFGDVCFKDVFFSYDSDKLIMQNVNICFPQGSKTAIVGKNGTGKTTIIKLLTRVLLPSSGNIFLNNTNIMDIPLQEYRNSISIVSQQVYLFDDTIRNNIALYKEVDEKLLQTICKDSGLEEYLNEVSLEYKTGQNGARLSGGQKQKIALARALLHDKPIIIFDEATANIDSLTEKKIAGLLSTRLKDKTVIIITHKSEILNKMNQIIMLQDDGNIVKGNYNELINTSSSFRNMLHIKKANGCK